MGSEVVATSDRVLYGYMRVGRHMTDQEVRDVEEKMRNFARRNGFSMGMIFHEVIHGSLDVFEEMVTHVRRANGRHVVVPLIEGLTTNTFLRKEIVAILDENAHVKVLELDNL